MTICLLAVVALSAWGVAALLDNGISSMVRGAGAHATPGVPVTPAPAAHTRHATPVAHPSTSPVKKPSHTAPVYAWVLTLQWAGGMVTCASAQPAPNGYQLFVAALTSCRSRLKLPDDSVVTYWTFSDNSLSG